MISRLKYVIIEDNSGDLYLLKNLMLKLGVDRDRIAEANTLEQAMDLIPAFQPDCILLDLNLPDSHGMETISTLLSIDPHFVYPLVVLTGKNELKTGLESIATGAQEFIAKHNLSLETLQHTIRFAMERSKIRRLVKRQYETLESYSYSIAHDIKTPLSRMYQLAVLSKAKATDPEQLKMLELIEQTATESIDFIKSLLQSNFTQINLTRLVKKVTQSYYDLYQDEYLDIEEDFQHTDYLFNTEEKTIMVILNNLIDNAIKYTDKKKLKCQIKISTEDYSKGILLTVSDNGVGIAEDKIPNLFEKKASNPDQELSSGVGLSLVHQLVESQGGKIEVSSQSGEGTSFQIYLPSAL